MNQEPKQQLVDTALLLGDLGYVPECVSVIKQSLEQYDSDPWIIAMAVHAYRSVHQYDEAIALAQQYERQHGESIGMNASAQETKQMAQEWETQRQKFQRYRQLTFSYGLAFWKKTTRFQFIDDNLEVQANGKSMHFPLGKLQVRLEHSILAIDYIESSLTLTSGADEWVYAYRNDVTPMDLLLAELSKHAPIENRVYWKIDQKESNHAKLAHSLAQYITIN